MHANVLMWVPLRRQPAIRISLAAGCPLNLVGIAITLVTWGFLEGFFGIYFCSKDQRSRRPLWAWLARARGVGLCSVQWGRSPHRRPGLGRFITSFASGYAITVVPAVTGNGWGGTLVQTLTNAVGKLTK
jgi:hypothetical protein